MVASLPGSELQTNLQTQQHNITTVSQKPFRTSIPKHFSFRLRKWRHYRYLLVHPQWTNYNGSDKKN
ncbi:hypothetical protein EBL_c08210 [Shimwellia blattae DSM 4481 = NBRC 105725]|uniref:Uncharacterized protein n=2 Tax=Shimwellia blattae TaxID=563 RepID=I2B5Y7_SHIBC|nr:hypothetical protein EBL_c08210 [Shimwellia blattae DSM 4481 = NBRC 105725]